MILLPTPVSAYSSHRVSLAGKTYVFDYRYNTYSSTWHVDIYLNNIIVKLNTPVTAGSLFFFGYPVEYFEHGKLIPLRFRDTTAPIGRDNLGIGKDYTLCYLSNEEWESLGE